MSKLGVYVHIPFCLRKCLYCDFLSFAQSEQQYMPYKNALLNEIAHTPELERDIDTVFIGGGTPSILPPGVIAEILMAIGDTCEDAEITLEVNPATATAFNEYREMGINRISFGMQSTHDNELRRLGRIHSYADFLRSYHSAKRWFDNISVDIMYSLPHQDVNNWETTLRRTISLNPEHISVYGLIIEENTVFARMLKDGSFSETDEMIDREMYSLACELLFNAGYSRYEISNFARPGYISRHNVKYWTRAEYIGLGLGAHSLVDDVRFRNTEYLDEYISLNGLNIRRDSYNVTTETAMAEFMFLGLRMANGISREEFYKCFNQDLYSVYGSIIKKHVKNGLLIEASESIYLSQRGVDVSNIVMSDFL